MSPQITLTLDGEILVDVAVEPRQLVFAQVALGSQVTKTLSVKVSEPDKVKITKVSVDDDRFTVKLTEGDPSGNATYDVAFAGSKEIGRLSHNVRIEFTGGAVPHLDVPLRGQVVGDLSYPQRLSFNKRDGSFTERDVRITSRSKRPVKILSAQDPDQHLVVELTEAQGEAGVVHVKVATPDAQAPRPLEGTLVIRTTDANEPEVKIPYGIYHQGGRLGAPPAAMPMRRPKGLLPQVKGGALGNRPK